jgi:hypothetical protein
MNKNSVHSQGNPVSNLDDELSRILSSLSINKSLGRTNSNTNTASDPLSSISSTESLSEEESETLREALIEARENPIDLRKPYATPWRPRPFMSAFAFIPKYLEVNQNICSAVYLRHPVARPGLAEVPTPFWEEVNQLAFTWYLRRR